MKRDESTHSIKAFGSTFKWAHVKKINKIRKAVKKTCIFDCEESDVRVKCLAEGDVGSLTSENPEQDASGMFQR